MRRSAVVLLLALAANAQIFVRESRSGAVVEIDASKAASYRIPRTIYGTFLEPIGRSIYPGLWAQELENPSFEDNLWNVRSIARMIRENPALERSSELGLPLPWQPLDDKQGMRYEPRWGDAANSQRSLLLMGLPGSETGVRQRVYLPVHRALRYRGSLYAKHTGGLAGLVVSLRGHNDAAAVLASEAIALEGDAWKRYEFHLELPPGRVQPLQALDFAISLRDESRVLLDQVFLFPSDAVDGMDPDMIAMSRALKSPVVRYGGNFTSGYHWRDGVGPMDKRVTMLNQPWGMPEYNHFGTDEFLQFCKLVGAEPQIALNLGSGTPEEAAEWVRYVNARWGKGGLLWELGNELYGTWQIGYPTQDRIATRTREFSSAVRKADPAARLIATGQDPDHYSQWNAAQLALGPDFFQYLSTHFVVGTGRVNRKNPSQEFVEQSAFALPVGLERRLREMKQQIDADSHARGRVNLAFTEWLFHGNSRNVPQFANMGGAICAAGFLNALMRVADFTPIADMTGLVEFGGIWKVRGRVYGVPAYWAFRMYSNADATVPVWSRTTCEGFDVEQGNNRIPSIPDVPYLDVVAALNDARDLLTVFAVNRHASRDITAHLRITGFKAGGETRVLTLKSASLSDRNDEAQPEAVRPVASTSAAGDRFDYTFARASVTVLELRQ